MVFAQPLLTIGSKNRLADTYQKACLCNDVIVMRLDNAITLLSLVAYGHPVRSFLSKMTHVEASGIWYCILKNTI